MAIYNEILVGRYARALQKLFGIKGTVPAKQLAGELMPVHSVFNGTENRYLEGWNRFGVNSVVAASAGNQSGFRLRNPANSNIIAVVELLFAYTSVADNNLTLLFGPVATDFSAPQTPQRLDARSIGNSVCHVSSQNIPAPIGQVIAQMPVGANTLPAFPFISTDLHEIPLLPGDAIQISTAALNTILTTSCWWRERQLEESERA